MAPYQHLQGFGQLSLSRLNYRADFRHLSSLRFIINFPLHKIRFLVGKSVSTIFNYEDVFSVN